MSEGNLRADKHGSMVDGGAIQIITGDGRKGYNAEAPYDVIHVGAASPKMPQALIEQLKSPGRMFVPVGVHEQDVWCVDKDEAGIIKREKLFGQVKFLPKFPMVSLITTLLYLKLLCNRVRYGKPCQMLGFRG